VFFVGAGAAAAGLAAAVEFFGLNKSPRLNFGEADGDGLAAATAFVFACFPLVEAAGDAAGLAAVVASAFLRVRFAFGEAVAEASAEGDSAASVVDVVASAFLCPLCFVGACSCEVSGLAGDGSCATETPANPTTHSRARIFVVIMRG